MHGVNKTEALLHAALADAALHFGRDVHKAHTLRDVKPELLPVTLHRHFVRVWRVQSLRQGWEERKGRNVHENTHIREKREQQEQEQECRGGRG